MIDIGNQSLNGQVEVRLDLVPRSSIYMYAEFEGSPVEWFRTPPDGKLTFKVDGTRVPGFAVSRRWSSESGVLEIKWCPESEPVVLDKGNSTTMQQVVFHLFNFRNVLGTRRSSETRDNTQNLINYIDLHGSGWHVEMKSLFETDANLRLAREDGGQRLTHVGSVRRDDCQAFTPKDANEILNALHYFLSFARGGWCSPVCPVGFDAAGERVWGQWSSSRDWSDSQQNWFVLGHGQQLADLFPLFVRRWEEDHWREALTAVVYWYVSASASSRGVDAGIILIQAAIERLAYEYAVHEKRLISEEGFKKLRASDQFRLLLSSFNVPLFIPASATALGKWAAVGPANDGPHALTVIRNSLVHTGKRAVNLPPSAMTEAWNLGLWYVELSILAICGFAEKHWDRNTGTTQLLPWTTADK